MNEPSCLNCKHVSKTEDEYPCALCQRNYVNYWEPADTNDGAISVNDYSTEENDPVTHPSHYTQGAIETIDAIESIVSGMSGPKAYRLGNVVKYIARHEHKGGIEDLKKAAWYLQREIEEGEE